MAGGKGIEWMINLDAKTQGATDVIQALSRTETAAEKAGRMIDRALSKMDKLPKSMGDAGWSKGIGNLKQLAHGAQLTDREFGAVKARSALVSAELEKMGATGERHVAPLWQEVFKGQLALDAVKWGARQAARAVAGLWDIVRIGADEERTVQVFANMLGADEGRATMDYMDRFAKMSEFTNSQVEGMGVELLRAGLRGADFRNALGAALDVAAQAPDKMEGATEAIAALSRIAMTGKVDFRTLRGLRLDPHEVENQLAKDLALAPDVVKKRLQEGALKGTDAMGSIFTALEKKSGKQLGQLGDDMSTGFTARLDKLRDVPEEIFKDLRATQGFRDVSDTLGRLGELFGPESETGQRIQAALIKTLDVVGAKIKEIDWERVAGFIANVAESMEDWVEPLSKIADLLGYVVKAFSGLLALPTLGKDIGDWFARKLNPEINQDPAYKQEAIDRVGAANDKAWEAMGARAAFAEQDGYKKANDQHSPSRVWMRMGQDTVEGLAVGIESASPRASAAAAGVVAPPSLGDMSGVASASRSFAVNGLTVPITIQVGGSSSSAEDIAREVAAQAPAALMEALEQANAMAGLA